jgi:predicted nucleotidyltransferase component of viral defense system
MPDSAHLKEWIELPNETKLRVFTETGTKMGLLPVAVEKDWWVVHTLALIFSMPCAGSLVFKGGTSLSKGWNLIQRFSEDIDLVLDKEFLGFKGELGNNAIKKLRKKSHNFLTNKFTKDLQAKFIEVGLVNVTVKHKETEHDHIDPIVIEIYYPKLTEHDAYLKPGVLVEVGSRSLRDPFTNRTFSTMVAENYSKEPFSDNPITVPTVNPIRTFLEKIFLLHEEHQRPDEKRRVNRLSRHLYDIEKLSATEYAEAALNDSELYKTIVEHRKKYNRISGVDYDKHNPDKISFIPPESYLPAWETDYKEMRESMIYREALPFAELIKKLKELQSRINNIQWN